MGVAGAAGGMRSVLGRGDLAVLGIRSKNMRKTQVNIFKAILNAIAAGVVPTSDGSDAPLISHRSPFYLGYGKSHSGKRRKNMLTVSKRVRGKHRRAA